MVDINCKISLEEAKKEFDDHYRMCKRQKRAIDLFYVLMLILVMVILLVVIRMFPNLNEKYILTVGVIIQIMMSMFFFYISIISKELDRKYPVRVELIKILPRIKNAYNIIGSFCPILEYTVEDDPNETIRCFQLDEFEVSESTIVKRITIDVDNFLVLVPYGSEVNYISKFRD